MLSLQPTKRCSSLRRRANKAASRPPSEMTATAPALVAYVGDAPLARLDPPPFTGVNSTRAWLLGVMAVQLRVNASGLTAQLRSHVTGEAQPTFHALYHQSVLHIALRDEDSAITAIPQLAPQRTLGSDFAQLTLFVDGQ